VTNIICNYLPRFILLPFSFFESDDFWFMEVDNDINFIIFFLTFQLTAKFQVGSQNTS